ncbi:hypothetical protein JCM8097_008682 [Rhodosporidiobolus ruineniae]
MGDDRFSYLHQSGGPASHLLDEEDEMLGWELPEDDILVPAHLLPPYQDEDDETVLPSQAHPSYPYGNPYKPHLLTSPSRRNPSGHHPSSASTSSLFHPSGSGAHSSAPVSLATTLPALELRDLFARTTFGDAPDRQWAELHLPGLFGRKTKVEQAESEEERDAMHNAHGDAGPPAGQNAGDAPEEEDEDDDEGETDEEDDGTGTEGSADEGG